MEKETVTAEVPVETPNKLNENKEPASSTDLQDHVTDNNDKKAATEGEVESSKVMDSPACDWLEPLEEDCDDESFDQESLAGSEWSVTNSRRNGVETGGRGGGVKRKRISNHNANENWEDCPVLGQGWKRKEVFRRSGTSEGRSDTYYMGPAGQKVRSRVELMKYVDQSLDLTRFDFKSGKIFNDGKRRKMRSFSPCLSRNVGDTRTVTPPKRSSYTVTDATRTTQPHLKPNAVPANPSASILGNSLSGSSNGFVNGSGKPFLGICSNCNKSFTVEQGQTMCPNCRKMFNMQIERRRTPHRKWVPCGRCRACQVTVDCGKCVRCRNGRIRLRLNVNSGKVIKCRKRKCLHPIRKSRPAKVNPQISKEHVSNTQTRDTPSSFSKPSVSDCEESQSTQCSDSEDLSPFENDGDNGVDETGAARGRRRSCGTCGGCVRRTDCGTCDFCMDKPKFGGSNKKRQKCRLRQCQREAMKHLLPADEEEMAVPQDWVNQSRRRTHGRPRKSQDFDASDNEAEQYGRPKARVSNGNRLFSSYSGKTPDVHKGLRAARCESFTFPASYVEENFRQEKRLKNFGYHEEQQETVSSPSITQIFSMADSTTKGIDADHELMPLLESLRNMVLPVLWFCIVVEGPQLQLMQCSKRSPMADTVVNIEPGFQYHVSVQGQPLLPTHKLYDIHPARLTTTKEVVALLEDLERHSICQGFDNRDSSPGSEPVLPERVATCDFLISPESKRCAKCATKKPQQA